MRAPVVPSPAFLRGVPSSSVLAAAVVLSAACADTNPMTAPGAAPGTATFALGLASNASADTLRVGETVQLKASLAKRHGQTVGTAAVWRSSAVAVATVSAAGLVTAVAPGTTTITAANNLDSESVTILVLGTQPPIVTAPVPAPVDSSVTTAVAVPGAAPELPRVYLDTRAPAVTGRTLVVAAGGNFQAALDSAQYGDVLSLQAGATFTGNFVLRRKSGTGWIVIQSSASASALPGEGVRITPAYASQLPKIVSPNADAAIATEPAAHNYRLTGIEVTAAASVTLNYGLVNFGASGAEQSTLSQVPTALVLDRSYVHGTSVIDLKRCVTLNSASSAVVDSYLADCHGRGMDTQAILGWNGPGPFKITNNYLAGAGENVMFGGADPSIPNLVSADIEVRNNDFVKPDSWKGVWTVKNLFELKNARRVVVEENRFEGNWLDGQTGGAIVLKSHNQDGACNWCVTEHVTFRYNRVRRTGSGFVLSAAETYNGGTVVPMNNILISQNVLELMNTGIYTGANRTVQIGGGTNIVFDHNTFLAPDASQIMAIVSPIGTGFRFTNNIGSNGQYGVHADGTGTALDALATGSRDYVFSANAVMGTSGSGYPTGNYFPATLSDAQRLTGNDATSMGATSTRVPAPLP